MRISKSRFDSKPKNLAVINNELVKATKKDLSSKELAGKLEEGHTVVLSDWKEGEKRLTPFFISTKYLVLDFDNLNYTLEDTMNQLDELGIDPTIIYYSFSADMKEKHNHRVIFELDKEITDPREAKFLILALLKLFPEADGQCKDLLRLYHGSNKPVEYNEDAILETAELVYLIKKYFYELDNTTGKKTAEVKSFAQMTGIELINGQLNMGADLHEIKWTVSADEALNKTKTTRGTVSYKKHDLKQTKVNRELISVKMDTMYELFPLLKDFVEGKYWADYGEIMFIASNLAFVRGGLKLVHDVIDKYDFYDNDDHDRAYYHVNMDSYINNYPDPKPHNFTGAFEQYSSLGKNMIQVYRKSVDDEIIRVEGEKKKMSTQEGLNLMNDAFEEALKADEGVYVIKVPVGLGKTFSIVNENYVWYDKTVIALPTHQLIEEVVQRFDESYKSDYIHIKPAHVLEKPYDLLPEKERDTVRRLHTAGDIETASAVFRTTVRKYGLSKDERVKEYNKSTKAIRDSKVAITTHKQALSQQVIDSMKPELLIIDEDPFMTMLDTTQIKISDVEQMALIIKNQPNNYYFSKWIDEVIDIIKESQLAQQKAIEARYDEDEKNTVFAGAVFKIPNINFSNAAIYNKIVKMIKDGTFKPSSAVLKLLEGGYFTLDVNVAGGTVSMATSIVVAKTPKLPNVKKIIIFSATASEQVYKKAFPDCNFIDIGAVENQGQIIQFHDYNTSKKQLPQHEEAIEIVMSQYGIGTVLTFKDMDIFNKFYKPLHLGNTQGYDFLKGNNLAVAGTFNLPESLYNLYVYALTENIPSRMNNYNVTVHGLKTKLFTYETGFSRDFHWFIVETQLVQALGRARTIRTDATVTVFSKYPLREADKHMYKGKEI